MSFCIKQNKRKQIKKTTKKYKAQLEQYFYLKILFNLMKDIIKIHRLVKKRKSVNVWLLSSNSLKSQFFYNTYDI